MIRPKSKYYHPGTWLCLYLLWSTGSLHAQMWQHNYLPLEAEPDVRVDIQVFEKNDQKKYLNFVEYEHRRGLPESKFILGSKYRMETDSSIFLDIHYKSIAYQYRFDYWLHFTEEGRPAIRQRVYLETDTSDQNGANDLLIYQIHYVAFQVTDPFDLSEQTKKKNIEGLKWIEGLLEQSYFPRHKEWVYAANPDIGSVSDYYRDEGTSSMPTKIEGDTYLTNYWHELYLGHSGNYFGDQHGLSEFILFYPIGTVKGIHPTGQIWISFSQNYSSAAEFSFVPKKLCPMSKRKYAIFQEDVQYVGSATADTIYYCEYQHGFKNGREIRAHRGEGYIESNYCYDVLMNEAFTSGSEAQNEVTFVGDEKTIRACKKAERRYARYCKKWKLTS